MQDKIEEAVGQWKLGVSYNSENVVARKNLSKFSNKINGKIGTGEDFEYLMDRGKK